MSFFYFSKDARIRALAAAWARHDHPLAEAFLEDRDSYGVNEVLKALSLLDAGRQVRVLEKKMKRLQFSTGKVKPQTMGRLKSDIDNLNAIKPLVGLTKVYVVSFIYCLGDHAVKDQMSLHILVVSLKPLLLRCIPCRSIYMYNRTFCSL